MSYITTTDNKDVLKTIFSKIGMFKTINFEDFITNLKESTGVMTGSKIYDLIDSKLSELYDNTSDLDVYIEDYDKFNKYLLSIGFIKNSTLNDHTPCFDDTGSIIQYMEIIKYSINDHNINVIVHINSIGMICDSFELKYCARCVDADFIQYSNCIELDGPTDHQVKILDYLEKNITKDTADLYFEYMIQHISLINKYTCGGISKYLSSDIIYTIINKCNEIIRTKQIDTMKYQNNLIYERNIEIDELQCSIDNKCESECCIDNECDTLYIDKSHYDIIKLSNKVISLQYDMITRMNSTIELQLKKCNVDNCIKYKEFRLNNSFSARIMDLNTKISADQNKRLKLEIPIFKENLLKEISLKQHKMHASYIT